MDSRNKAYLISEKVTSIFVLALLNLLSGLQERNRRETNKMFQQTSTYLKLRGVHNFREDNLI